MTLPFPDLADHVQSQYVDTLCELMVQRLTLLSQENEKLQDDEQEASISAHQERANEKEEFDETQRKDSLHGQKKVAEEASGQPRNDEVKFSKEEQKEEEHGTQSGKLFIFKEQPCKYTICQGFPTLTNRGLHTVSWVLRRAARS